MRRFRFPIAVAVTSLALVVALAAAGAPLVRNALAGGPWTGGPWHGGPWAHGPGFELPAELQGLGDVPPDQRFSHFVGAQLSLKDKDNRPLTVNVTPGTVTAASATSLTIAANDGSTKTVALDDKTMIHGKAVRGGAQATQPTLANGDKVVVVTLNNSTTATAVVAGVDRSGPPGPKGPWGHFGRGS